MSETSTNTINNNDVATVTENIIITQVGNNISLQTDKSELDIDFIEIQINDIKITIKEQLRLNGLGTCSCNDIIYYIETIKRNAVEAGELKENFKNEPKRKHPADEGRLLDSLKGTSKWIQRRLTDLNINKFVIDEIMKQINQLIELGLKEGTLKQIEKSKVIAKIKKYKRV